MIGAPARSGFRPAARQPARRLPSPFGAPFGDCPLPSIGTTWAAQVVLADNKIELWKGRLGKKLYPNADEHLAEWQNKRATAQAAMDCQYAIPGSTGDAPSGTTEDPIVDGGSAFVAPNPNPKRKSAGSGYLKLGAGVGGGVLLIALAWAFWPRSR